MDKQNNNTNIQQTRTSKNPIPKIEPVVQTSVVSKTDKIITPNKLDTRITLDHKIVCRKCQGNHFTAKCTNSEKQQVQSRAPDKEKQYVQPTNCKPYNTNSGSPQTRPKHRQYFKTTYRVKISELPVDITEEEVLELTNEWGHIVRAKVLNYQDSNSSNAYIDFGYEEEADYFVKALDRTPFEMLMIDVSRVETYRT
jgi:hypothetical protein